ncbi:hypothetical protein OQJ13_08695 [Legionella sp. PATHC035]|uniref:hypothetical protein n=1 Tax=Legionella sp. PATHC035 TaxID=2992040 RepID=UPI002244B03B|nr:hypothetical protein [Legionella sp. PATHC035]MCW8409046.1 hypothetical protein [Legionella sp. PATHC035]
MNVYAYSVDNAVGFISTSGNGLVITVGGATGLANSQQYNPQQVITGSPGTPAAGSPFPVSSHYGVCSQTASSSLGSGSSFKFQLPSTSFPCVLTLEDSLKSLYHFTLKAPAPLTSTAADMRCAAEDQP